MDVEAQFGAAICDVNFTVLPLVMWNRLIAYTFYNRVSVFVNCFRGLPYLFTSNLNVNVCVF